VSEVYVAFRRLTIGGQVMDLVLETVADEAEGKLAITHYAQKFGSVLEAEIAAAPGLTVKRILDDLGIQQISHAVRKLPAHSGLVVPQPKVTLS